VCETVSGASVSEATPLHNTPLADMPTSKDTRRLVRCIRRAKPPAASPAHRSYDAALRDA
jgi:hypothetical protein